MPSKSSDNELLRKLSKTLGSFNFPPESISAASADADPFNIEFSGSRAVDDCVKAYNKAYRAAIEKKENDYGARKAGAIAYRQAIPALHGSTNIADFIACVGHALVLGCIEGAEATRLLYAAQIAHTALPAIARDCPMPRPKGRPARDAEPAISKPTKYIGPEDDWAGVDDPGLRAWYNQHYPNPNAAETQNLPVNE